MKTSMKSTYKRLNHHPTDNCNMKHESIDQQLDDLERILQRSRIYNVTWKLADLVVGVAKDGKQKISILGFSVSQNHISIPEKRKKDYATDIPRTRKDIGT